MQKAFIPWIIWLLGAFAYYVISGSLPAAVLLLASLVLPILSFLLSLAAARRVRVVISAPFIVQKNDAVLCSVRFKNEALLPLWRVQCKIRTQNLLTGAEKRAAVSLPLMPKTAKSVELELQSAHCGTLQISAETLCVFDMFGVFRRRKPISAQAKTTVLPNTFDMLVTVSQNSARLLDSDEYSLYKPGWDRSETFQIRDYAEGDSVRNIHWKLTTKYDRLIVRDPSLPILDALLLVWDKSLPPSQTASPDTADTLAEAFVSLCQALVAGAYSFTIAYNDPVSGLLEAAPVTAIGDLPPIIARLLSIPPTAGALPALGLLDADTTQRGRPTLAYFAHHIPGGFGARAELEDATLFVCADEPPSSYASGRVISFSSADYTKVLGDISI